MSFENTSINAIKIEKNSTNYLNGQKFEIKIPQSKTSGHVLLHECCLFSIS